MVLTVSCRSPGTLSGTLESQAANDLTWTEAKARKKRIDHVDYALTLTLNASDPAFKGLADIAFDLSDSASPLRLDFFQGSISALSVNEKSLDLDTKKPFWIEIPADRLHEGRNHIRVTYFQEYSRQGQGLHRFVDPETKQVFLYSQFQPFDANRFMPCFDQPDLRSTLTLKVEAPARWQVISTASETEIKPVGADRRMWSFSQTQPLPTYLFSLHAGPYKVWKDQYQDVPLRIFARPSVAKFVRSKDWFKITKQGLAYFGSYFNYAYPFKKYDQIFVPEFDGEAMENVGAVTFGEDIWSRGELTRHERLEAASVLLHEMAHMWFGNIVTMKWWNDLWLNESFASLMSTMALHDATEFKEAWLYFLTSEERAAYREDALVTSHPVEAPVNSVRESFANFDGITYGKGAAVLKQLRVHMGPDAFKRAIQKYITDNAFKNADLANFIAHLQNEAPNRNLARWSERWLRQSGTDKLTANWSCEGDQLKVVRILTTPSPGARFRPQTLTVALFNEKQGVLESGAHLKIEVDQPEVSVKGQWPCPALVYPNFDSEGFAQVQLDPTSLRYIRQRLHAVKDDTLRTMLWQDLWSMVRATQLPLKDYVALVEREFGRENNRQLIDQIAATINSANRSEQTILYYWPENRQDEKLEFISRMENQYLRRYRAASPGSDEQKLWLEKFVNLAQTPHALDELFILAQARTTDLIERWQIARQLSRYRHPQARKLVASLRRADASDRGQRAILAIEAVQPLPAIKRKWVDILKQPRPTISLAEAEGVLSSLFPAEQKNLAQAFKSDFYEYLRRNGNSENEVFVESVARGLSPLSCEPDASARLREFLADESRFVPTVARSLKVSLQEDELCQHIRASAQL